MLAMDHGRAVISEVRDRYIKAAKKGKTKILEGFCATTGYNRIYAARILRLSPGRTIGYSKICGKKVKYVIGKEKKIKRVRTIIYTYAVFLALRKIWAVFDFICSKRLKPFMKEAIEKLTKHKEIDLIPSVKEKLLKILCFYHRQIT